MLYLIGCSWFALATVLTVLALAFDTTRGRVYNIGLLTNQICLIVAAGTCWIVGSVFFVGGCIFGAINDVRRTIQFYERRKIAGE